MPILYASPPLFALPRADPRNKPPHARAIAPQQMKELSRIQLRRLRAVKSLQTPTNVRAGPGTQAMPLGSDPVVANRSEKAAEAHRAPAYHPSASGKTSPFQSAGKAQAVRRARALCRARHDVNSRRGRAGSWRRIQGPGCRKSEVSKREPGLCFFGGIRLRPSVFHELGPISNMRRFGPPGLARQTPGPTNAAR